MTTAATDDDAEADAEDSAVDDESVDRAPNSAADSDEGPASSTTTDSRTATRTESGTAESTPTGDDRYTRKRCVLITGCSSGIGKATARAFLEEDWQVVATARNLEDVADLDDAGCHTLELDVTDSARVPRVVERAVEIGGAIDCLVNNAGYAQLGPLEDISTADMHRQYDVNVYGPHRLIRAALPHMRAQESGRIINVSSVFGRIAVGGTGAYAGSKHALEAMSDALRAEVEAFDIEVVVVEPGPVETSLRERMTDEAPQERTTAYESVYDLFEDAQLVGGGGPLAVEPDDVAAAIVHAGTCPEPPARYPVGPVAEYGLYARFLPDRLRDAAFGLVQRLV